MNTIAHLSGTPLEEADNQGLNSSIIVSSNPTNSNNDREIKYLDPTNMKVGTTNSYIQIGGTIEGDEDYTGKNLIQLVQTNQDDVCAINTKYFSITANEVSVDNKSSDKVDLGKGVVSIKKADISRFTYCPENLYPSFDSQPNIAGILFVHIRYSGTVLSAVPAGSELLVFANNTILLNVDETTSFTIDSVVRSFFLVNNNSSLEVGDIVQGTLPAGTYRVLTDAAGRTGNTVQNFYALLIRVE